MTKLVIHATNVTGLGACQVVCSLLNAFDSNDFGYTEIVCYAPESGPVAEFHPNSSTLRIERVKRFLPKALSRMLECLFPSFYFDLGQNLLVLGDIPLRTNVPQVLLVHQPHLISPQVDESSNTGVLYCVMRLLTRMNASKTASVVVQTDAMRSALMDTYGDWCRRRCITVIGQPVPVWFDLSEGRTRRLYDAKGLRLFYPAAGYPHKNHDLIRELAKNYDELNGLDVLTVTLPPEQFDVDAAWLNCVGRLNHEACLNEYEKSDALVFPSVLESYGLPLVEAMTLGIPILVSDLPYAHALCGDEAIYFDPQSADSLKKAILLLNSKLQDGWEPEWEPQLSKLPKTWSEVARQFVDLF